MAHYALMDENNIVVNVIVGKDEDDGDLDWEEHYSEITGLLCKRTSYNMHGGVHSAGKTPFRMNYASVGGTYDEERDAFLPLKPYNSWILNEDTCTWKPPVPLPELTQEQLDAGITGSNFVWNEETISWDGPLDTPS